MSMSRGFSLLALATILAHGSIGWANNDTPEDQAQSSHIALVRAYALRDFHQSPLDRLSGGLPQRSPYRMVSDSKGRILMTDPAISAIQVLDVEHQTRSQIGGEFQHRLDLPGSIAVDADDNIYVTDRGLHAVLVFQRDGRFLRIIGQGLLNFPTGIALDKGNRKLYVADWWSRQILVFDLDGNPLQVGGSEGFGAGQLYGPTDIVLHHGALVVLDSHNNFDIFDLQGNFLGALSSEPGRTPMTFAFDGDGNLFYLEFDSGALVATDPQGRVLAKAAKIEDVDQWTPGQFPVSFTCLATDQAGGIMALGPSFEVETLKIEAAKSSVAP